MTPSLRLLEPTRLVADYDDHLASLSDCALAEAAIDAVARPPRESSSFLMHAPLEILARVAQLPDVSPERRRLARMQLVATAVAFGKARSADRVGPESRGGEAPAITRRLCEAIEGGDVDAAHACALALADAGSSPSVLAALAERTAPFLGAAVHGPIFLQLCLRTPPQLRPLRLLPGIARALAASPDVRIRSALRGPDGVRSAPPAEVGRAFEQATLAVTSPRPPRYMGIAPLVQAAEEGGAATRALAPAWGILEASHVSAAFAGLARSAARSMVDDAVTWSKYGWSHALTIPHGWWGLSPLCRRPTPLLHAASIVLLAHRAGYGETVLDAARPLRTSGQPLGEALLESPRAAAAAAAGLAAEARPGAWTMLSSEASVRTDAHLVKYVWTCRDAAGMDPAGEPLYLAAAATLTAVWMAEVPEEALLSEVTSSDRAS